MPPLPYSRCHCSSTISDQTWSDDVPTAGPQRLRRAGSTASGRNRPRASTCSRERCESTSGASSRFSQRPIGGLKPIFRFASGRAGRCARRGLAQDRLGAPALELRGARAARSTCSTSWWSVNGARTSSPCAMLIRSPYSSTLQGRNDWSSTKLSRLTRSSRGARSNRSSTKRSGGGDSAQPLVHGRPEESPRAGPGRST